MARPPVHYFDVDVRPGADREPLEEVVHELRLEIADLHHADFQVDDGVRPAAQIDRGVFPGLRPGRRRQRENKDYQSEKSCH